MPSLATQVPRWSAHHAHLHALHLRSTSWLTCPAAALALPAFRRASIPAGNVSEGQIQAAAPFDNTFVAKEINASTLLAALNSGLSGWTGDDNGAGRFPQVMSPLAGLLTLAPVAMAPLLVFCALCTR